MKQLKQVNHSSGLELQSLKSEVASLKVKRSEEVSLQKSALGDKMKAEHRKEVELLVKEHTREIEALTSQVDMFRHNQRGVDEVCEQLREKEVEVKSLQDTITRMKVGSSWACTATYKSLTHKTSSLYIALDHASSARTCSIVVCQLHMCISTQLRYMYNMCRQ